MDAERDKQVERDRYERRARDILDREATVLLGPDGALAMPRALRQPYHVFEEYIRRHATPKLRVLDVCCGNGLNSVIAARGGAQVVASDIAPHNLELVRLRAARAAVTVETVVADAENLPFDDHSFDLIICAGSLSYLCPEKFMAELRRVAVPGGLFLCIDSLDHNPIYRLNRFIQYLRGRRSLTTLRRMPTMATIAWIQMHMAESEVSFHGSCSFLVPLMQPALGEERTTRWLDDADRRWPILRRWAFKFVLFGRLNSG